MLTTKLSKCENHIPAEDIAAPKLIVEVGDLFERWAGGVRWSFNAISTDSIALYTEYLDEDREFHTHRTGPITGADLRALAKSISDFAAEYEKYSGIIEEQNGVA